jgi:hypothetical protein
MIDHLPNEILLGILYFVDYFLIPFLPFVERRFNDLISSDQELSCIVFNFSSDPYQFLRSPLFFQYKTLVRYLFRSVKPRKLISWPKWFKENTKMISHLPDWFIIDFILPHRQTCHQLMIAVWESLIRRNKMKTADAVFMSLRKWIRVDSWTESPQFPKYQRVLENILITQCKWKWFERWFGRKRLKSLPDNIFFKCAIQITNLCSLKKLVQFWCDLNQLDEKSFWYRFCRSVSDSKINYFIGKIIKTPNDILEYAFTCLPRLCWLSFLKRNNSIVHPHFAQFLKRHYSDAEITKTVNFNETNIYTFPFELLFYLNVDSSWKTNQKQILLFESAIESGNKDHIVWCLKNIDLNTNNIKTTLMSGSIIPTLEIIEETGLVDICSFSSHFDVSVTQAIEIYEKYNTLFNFKLSPGSLTLYDLNHINFWKHYFTLNNKLWPDSPIFRVLRKVFECYQASSNIDDTFVFTKFLKFIKTLFPDLKRADLYRCGLDAKTNAKNSYLLDYTLNKHYNLYQHNIFLKINHNAESCSAKNFQQLN